MCEACVLEKGLKGVDCPQKVRIKLSNATETAQITDDVEAAPDAAPNDPRDIAAVKATCEELRINPKAMYDTVQTASQTPTYVNPVRACIINLIVFIIYAYLLTV